MNDLLGASDLHLHTGPDQRERWFDDSEAAEMADEHGMYAIVLKQHWTTTADRAIIAARTAQVKTVKVVGALVLNNAVGGLNPVALEKSLALGARVVWMPTHDAAFHRRAHGEEGGITLADPSRRSGLLKVVEELVDMCVDQSAIIATGHIDANEIELLARFAQPKAGKILVTHPEWVPTAITLDEQRQLKELGVMFERCAVGTTFGAGQYQRPIQEIVQQIREIGPGSTVLSSDLGVMPGTRPFEGLIEFYDALERAGVSHEDLMLMSRDNPRRLLESEKAFT